MTGYRLALALTALALVAGGCGDDDPAPKIAGPTQSTTIESETTTSPGTESPSSTAPTETPSEEPTVESNADEVATAWLTGLSDAFGSGEFADVDRLTGPGCTTCSDLVDPVRETYDQGGSYDADPIRVLSVIPQDDPQVVQVEVEFPAGELTESAGAEPSTFDSSQDTLEFTVKTTPGGKDIVAKVEFLP